MSWWCRGRTNAADAEDAVEVKVKTTLGAAETWIDTCRARRAQNEQQRRVNQRARAKLEEERSKLLREQKLATERLEKIQNSLRDIEMLFDKVTQAEKEIQVVEEQIKQEEHEMATREDKLKGYLNSIAQITAQSEASTASQELQTATPMRKTRQRSPITPQPAHTAPAHQSSLQQQSPF